MPANSKKKQKQGMLIVIDGLDGSGKATQQKLLLKSLQKLDYKVKVIDFPQYYDNFMGKFLGECLIGEHGDWISLDPYIASTIYAVDRFESKDKITQWLEQGYVVIADRYTTSNQLYQGAKITDIKKQKKLLRWLDHLEHEIFKLPRPDLVIYLDIPVDVSIRLSAKHNPDKKSYSNGKLDIHEGNLELQEKVRRNALKFITKQGNWEIINCMNKNELMSVEDIAQKVLNKVLEIL